MNVILKIFHYARFDVTILNYNLRDNCNSYILKEDGTYTKKKSNGNSFDIFKEFYKIDSSKVEDSIIL